MGPLFHGRLSSPLNGMRFLLQGRCTLLLWMISTLCGEGELVGGVHTLVGGVVQVYQVQEEEEKGRKVEKEIEREKQGEENAQMTMHMWMR